MLILKDKWFVQKLMLFGICFITSASTMAESRFLLSTSDKHSLIEKIAAMIDDHSLRVVITLDSNGNSESLSLRLVNGMIINSPKNT